MPKNDKNLEWVVESIDLSSVSLQDLESDSVNIETNSSNEVITPSNEVVTPSNIERQPEKITENTTYNDEVQESVIDPIEENMQTIDESVFLDSWEKIQEKTQIDEWENFWKYLRRFFISTLFILLWIIAIVFIFLFDNYITKSTQTDIKADDQKFIDQYKPRIQKVKSFIWTWASDYKIPTVWSETALDDVNKIINATDLDYIEKRDLLSSYASDIVNKTQSRISYIESLKQEIARQWFLPEELDTLLAKEKAIDTIQRSLNALEIIKFSTATKVFSYMNTALTTIVEMVKVWWANIDSIKHLFTQLWSRGEKDIASYVYMCYLNPFETNANCDTIWDLDLYYNNIINDKEIDIKLFKNSMNAISQLLEKSDTSLFTITFNWFNAQDKNISFNIEVFTNQDDERTLMSQWKRNPNIFILTNIINLLKQSSFIIGANINTKEVHVEPRTINLWWLQRLVNYSTMNFTVPIQKDTEREIFDYIDLDTIDRLLSKISPNQDKTDDADLITDENEIEDTTVQEDFQPEDDVIPSEEDWDDFIESESSEINNSELDESNWTPENERSWAEETELNIEDNNN